MLNDIVIWTVHMHSIIVDLCMANRKGQFRQYSIDTTLVYFFLLFYTLNPHIWSGIISNSCRNWSKCLSRMAENTERGGAGLSTRRRAQQMTTAFRKPFICPFSWFRVACRFDLCVYFGLIKSLLAAKLLWGRELKVDVAHSRGSGDTKENSLPFFLVQRVKNFNSFLSELPRRRNSPALP